MNLLSRIPMLLALALVGCNGVQLKTNGDADAGATGCNGLPTLSCEPVSSGNTACTGPAAASGNGALLPTDASFPVGCQAYFHGTDCSSHGYCTCDGDDAGASARWNCHEADGGS